MGVVDRTQFAHTMAQDVQAIVDSLLTDMTPVHPMIFDVQENESGAYKTEIDIIGLSDLEEIEEREEPPIDEIFEGPVRSGRTHKFARQVPITEEVQEDTNLMAVRRQQLAEYFAQAYMRAREKWCANIFNYAGYTAGHAIYNATTTGYTDPSGDLLYDSKPLVALSGNGHSGSVSGTAIHNGLALTLSYSNLQTADLYFRNSMSYDERGNRVQLSPRYLLVPSALRHTARQITQNPAQPDVTDRNINTVGGDYEVMEWQYLSDTAAWALLEERTKQFLKLQIVKPLTVGAVINELTGVISFYAKARWRVMIKDWRWILGSGFPTS